VLPMVTSVPVQLCPSCCATQVITAAVAVAM
jgi:hypothetical protein